MEVPGSSHKSDAEVLEPSQGALEQGEAEAKAPILSDVTQSIPHPAMGDAFVREPLPMQNPIETRPVDPTGLHQENNPHSSPPAPPTSHPGTAAPANVEAPGNHIVGKYLSRLIVSPTTSSLID